MNLLSITSITLEYLAPVLVLVAVWLIGSLDVRGQKIMLAAQGVWLAFACLNGLWSLAAQSVVLAVLTIRAIKQWTDCRKVAAAAGRNAS